MLSTDAREALSRLAGRPAVVTVDIHRGHLDPEVATMPLPADVAAAYMERVLPLLAGYRELGLPIVHVVTAYRSSAEILNNAYWRYQAGRPDSARAAVAAHNLEGMPGLELMPGVFAEGDVVVSTKKRYDCFVATDLEFVLRSGDHDSLILLGVNTNSCVIATAIAASVRDFAVFVVEDGVDTMLGRELHEAALRVIAASFGWVVEGETSLTVLRRRAAAPAQVG